MDHAPLVPHRHGNGLHWWCAPRGRDRVDTTASAHQRITKMRTTITLDSDVFEAAQAMAQASGKRLGEVVSQLARRGLRTPPDSANHAGLPVFKVSADAPVIPGNRARDLLAEDAT